MVTKKKTVKVRYVVLYYCTINQRSTYIKFPNLTKLKTWLVDQLRSEEFEEDEVEIYDVKRSMNFKFKVSVRGK